MTQPTDADGHAPVHGDDAGRGRTRREHSHGHSHSHGLASSRAGARHKGRLAMALAVLAAVTVVEVVGGLVTGSLALLSDAGHMLTDVSGIGMALAAIHVADRGATRRDRTYGLYRLEILAALANAVLLLGVAAYVMVEAFLRFLGGKMELEKPITSKTPFGAVTFTGSVLLSRFTRWDE